MRTTGSNAMVGHVWAQDNGAPMRSGSMHCEGAVCYSYSTPIAVWVSAPSGARVPLVTSRSYSITTSGKHMPAVWRGLAYSDRAFRVPNLGTSSGRAHYVSDLHAANVEALLADRDAAILTASRARSGKPWYLERAETLDQTARRYATTFELPAPAAMPDLADLRKAASEVKAANKARDAARAAVRAAELEAQLAEREARKRKDKARVAAWVAGRGERFPYTWIDGPTRLRKRADFLETSRGAEVPWPHAVRAFEAVKQVRASGIPFAANGRTIHLGHFTLDAIDKAGNVVAGCHRVEWKEIARLMKKEGVL